MAAALCKALGPDFDPEKLPSGRSMTAKEIRDLRLAQKQIELANPGKPAPDILSADRRGSDARPLGRERVLLSVRVYCFCRFLRGLRRLDPPPETTSTRSTPITPIHLYYTAERRGKQGYFGMGEITIRR